MSFKTKEDLERLKKHHEEKAAFYARKLEDIKPQAIGFKYGKK